MANNLLKRLREKDKSGLFNPSQNSTAYKTGFLPFDYRNGFKMEVRDFSDKVTASYPSVGLCGGTFFTIIGKTGVAKTTFCIQIAYNIVKPFDNGFVIHYDLEQATSYTRIKNITGASQEALMDKYILRQEKNYLEDIFDSIITIANEKEADKNSFMYDTGLADEFGNPIKTFVPTVILIDSLPTLSSRELSGASKSSGKKGKDDGVIKETEQMTGQTEAMRMAQKVKQFYKKLMPIIKTYNIMVIAINHVNDKVEVNAFTHTQPQVMYMKINEAVPGGYAPMYYAHTWVQFISKDKKTMEDDGFDGFAVMCWFLKSRTNKAGQSCKLIYNQLTGFDPIMTLYEFAKDNELVDGRNPYQFFKGFKDIKFNSKKFREEFLENEKLREALMETVREPLHDMLSSVSDHERDLSHGEVLERFFDAQEKEEREDK